MTQEDINSLSNEEFHQIYFERLNTLRSEITDILKKRKKPLKEHHKAIVNFLKSQHSTTFTINNINITLNVGDKWKGFRHILLRHYCIGCDGEINANDILTIGNIVENGRELTDCELKDNSLIGYSQQKNDEQYRLILKKNQHDQLIITVFSSKDNVVAVDLVEDTDQLEEGRLLLNSGE